MAAAAAAAAARSVLHSSSLRTAASRVASGARASSRPPILRVRPAAPRFLRSPVEMSFAVESLLPKHSATASALMTSMLTVSLKGYGWLSEGQDETR